MKRAIILTIGVLMALVGLTALPASAVEDTTPPVGTLQLFYLAEGVTPHGGVIPESEYGAEYLGEWTNEADFIMVKTCVDPESGCTQMFGEPIPDPQFWYGGYNTIENSWLQANYKNGAGLVTTVNIPWRLDYSAPDVSVIATKADSTPYVEGSTTDQDVTVTFSAVDVGNAGIPGSNFSTPEIFTESGTAEWTFTDRAGNSTTESFDVVIENAPVGPTYPTDGSVTGPNGALANAALAPFDAGELNTFKAKSTVPLKFYVVNGEGVTITDPSVVEGLRFVSATNLPPGETVDEPVVTLTGSTSFRMDASGQFTYNLSTKNLKAGSQYTYAVDLAGGGEILITFGLK